MTPKKITLQEMVKNYRGSCELWKVKMTALCISEMGVPNRLWEELMQDLMIRVCQYRHKEITNVSEGAILRTKIRGRILDFLRHEKRLKNNLQELDEDNCDAFYTVEILQLCGEDSQDTLCRAVRSAVSHLNEHRQRICRLFMQGYSKRKTARILNVTWRDMEKEIAAIRDAFVSMGIMEIIYWRRENHT